MPELTDGPLIAALTTWVKASSEAVLTAKAVLEAPIIQDATVSPSCVLLRRLGVNLDISVSDAWNTVQTHFVDHSRYELVHYFLDNAEDMFELLDLQLWRLARDVAPGSTGLYPASTNAAALASQWLSLAQGSLVNASVDASIRHEESVGRTLVELTRRGKVRKFIIAPSGRAEALFYNLFEERDGTRIYDLHSPGEVFKFMDSELWLLAHLHEASF